MGRRAHEFQIHSAGELSVEVMTRQPLVVHEHTQPSANSSVRIPFKNLTCRLVRLTNRLGLSSSADGNSARWIRHTLNV
jgi:hypothetical protein